MPWVDLATIPPGMGSGFQSLFQTPPGSGWLPEADTIEPQLDFSLTVNPIYTITLPGAV